MRWTGLIMVLVASVPAFVWAQAPIADDDEDVKVEEFVPAERLAVIQRRKFDLTQELTFLAGVLPVDPYYKGITATVGYTLHFGQSWAWEIAQFTYSYNVDTDLKTKLRQLAVATDGRPPDLPEIDWMVASHLVLKPLYGKETLFNTQVVHLEAFVQAGPAIVHKTAPISAPSLGGDFGAGLRLWLTPTWSVRLDIGEVLYAEEDSDGFHLRQTIHLHGGIAANLSGED